MRIITLILIIGLSNCSNSKTLDNQKLINDIQKLKTSKIILEILVDSIGTKLDTLSIGTSNDTLEIEYEREYDNLGKKQKMILNVVTKDSINGKTEILYDKNENVISEIVTLNGDTISQQFWKYNNEFLEQSEFYNFQFDSSKIIYYFAGKDKLLEEKQYYLNEKNWELKKNIKHIYDSKNNKTKSEETDILQESTNYIQYITILN